MGKLALFKKLLIGLLGLLFCAFVSLFLVTFVLGSNLRSLRSFTIMSGSMAPALPMGSVVLVKPSPFYFSGDIITFRPNQNSKTLVTHRITELKETEVYFRYQYLTKGDTNKSADFGSIEENQIIGKVFLIIPYLGYFFNFAKTPQGFILLVIIPATITIYEELRLLKREATKWRQKIKKKNYEVPPGKVEEGGLPRVSLIVPLVFLRER